MEMENGYCPITLRKKNSANKRPPSRSQSAPRRSYSSLAVRNLNSSSIRSQKVDEIRKEIEQEKKQQEKPIYKNLKPAIRHRREPQFWDDEGCIIGSNATVIVQNDEKKQCKNQSKMNAKSRKILKNCATSEVSEQSIVNRIKPPSRSQSALSMRRKKSNLDEFFDRQVKSVRNRETSVKHQQNLEREQKKKSYMNDESKKILTNSRCSSSLLSARKERKQEEYSFHPDMSLTLNRSVKGTSTAYTNSRRISLEMSILENRMEEEAKELAECTFAPDLSLTKKLNQKVRRNSEISRSQNRTNSNVRSNEKEGNRKCICIKDVPKRTRYINELLSGLRTPPCY